MEGPMVSRPSSLILAALALPALLAGCGSGGPEPLPPVSAEALAAVAKEPGVDREMLARAVDALFTAPDIGETRAVLVLRGGQVVAERYAPGYHENTRFISWSMAKTVTATMIGLLVSDGRLRLDESVPVPAWQRSGDPRGEITLRQLLQMRSGLRHTEAGDPVYKSDEVRMLFLDGRDHMAAYAEAQPLEAEPGRRFEYSTATTVILADLAARALTESEDPAVRREAVATFLRTRLFEPIGMKSMVPEFDRAGTLVGGSLIHGTARDWAKFGEFLRNVGSVKGAQVVPRGWMEFMLRPSPRNPGYGAQIWLNRTNDDGSGGILPGRAPKSLFAAQGHLGQYIMVSPDQKLTVVRLGKTDDDQRPGLVARLGDVVALFPRR
jgi:CubicO group peptidase (beta-lactamase class C family)